MITQPQTPRQSSGHGPYVRVSVADLVEGNRYIYGCEPAVGEIASLDVQPRGAASPSHHQYRYRWVNGRLIERRSWRDVLVDSLTQDQRDEIVREDG